MLLKRASLRPVRTEQGFVPLEEFAKNIKFDRLASYENQSTTC